MHTGKIILNYGLQEFTFHEEQQGETLRRVESRRLVRSMYLFRFTQIDEEVPILSPRHPWQLWKSISIMRDEAPCSSLCHSQHCVLDLKGTGNEEKSRSLSPQAPFWRGT